MNTWKPNQNPSSMYYKYIVEELMNEMTELDTLKDIFML